LEKDLLFGFLQTSKLDYFFSFPSTIQQAIKLSLAFTVAFTSGCRNPGADDLQPSDCLACRVAKDPLTNTCLEKCPKDTNPVEGKECLGKLSYNEFLIQFSSKKKDIARASFFL